MTARVETVELCAHGVRRFIKDGREVSVRNHRVRRTIIGVWYAPREPTGAPDIFHTESWLENATEITLAPGQEGDGDE